MGEIKPTDPCGVPHCRYAVEHTLVGWSVTRLSVFTVTIHWFHRGLSASPRAGSIPFNTMVPSRPLLFNIKIAHGCSSPKMCHVYGGFVIICIEPRYILQLLDFLEMFVRKRVAVIGCHSFCRSRRQGNVDQVDALMVVLKSMMPPSDPWNGIWAHGSWGIIYIYIFQL